MKKSEEIEKGSASLAECAFVAHQQLMSLTRGTEAVGSSDNAAVNTSESIVEISDKRGDNRGNTPASISLQDIVNTLLHPNQKNTLSNAALLTVTSQSASVRKLYEYVLKQTALFSGDTMVAASSSETLKRRQAKGFSIDLNDDPDLPEQVHILLQLEPDSVQNGESAGDYGITEAKTNEFNKLVIHLGWQNAFYQLVFNHSFKQKQGIAFQTIVSKTSPEYLAIVDTESRIYLTFLGN
jgi:hypothetical protein